MTSTSKHQAARDTIALGSGLGFLTGMFLPVGLMYLDVGFHLEDLPLALAVAIFVGSPFVGWGLLWWLYGVGVKVFGRPAMAYVNTVLLLILIAVGGWMAGYILTGGNIVAGVFGAVGLLMPNVFLFYSRRDYLYGEETETEQEGVASPCDSSQQ